MGWLNTLFDVANFTAEMYNINQVQQLRAQGATTQVIQEFLMMLRNRMFYYEQTAKDILEAEASEPRAAAGAMRVLEMRVLDSGITPEMFQGTSLEEMNRVDNTIRLIRNNSQRMCSHLSQADQAALEHMAVQADLLPEYSYYLDKYSDYLRYLQAKSDYENSAWMTKSMNMAGVGCLLFIGVSVIGATLFPRTPFVTLILAVAALVVAAMIGSKARAARTGKKTMEELDKSLNIQQLAKTHSQFQGNRAAAQQAYDAAEAELRGFFGSSALLPA